jgi:hypothetical protein
LPPRLLLAPASPSQPPPPNYIGITLPFDASSTLYVEGLPPDATEREVGHVFRKFEGQGFQSIRMRGIESNKNPGTSLFLCFAEFDNPHQATVAMYGLQGYRFDPSKPDGAPLKISYSKSKSGSGARGPPSNRAAPPAAAGGGYPERRESGNGGGGGGGGGGGRDERYDERYDRGRGSSGYGNDDRGQSYDDDGRGEPYEDEGRHHERRRGYDDERRDDYEESERGDDDVFRSADHVTMQGVTDT